MWVRNSEVSSDPQCPEWEGLRLGPQKEFRGQEVLWKRHRRRVEKMEWDGVKGVP